MMNNTGNGTGLDSRYAQFHGGQLPAGFGLTNNMQALQGLQNGGAGFGLQGQLQTGR